MPISDSQLPHPTAEHSQTTPAPTHNTTTTAAAGVVLTAKLSLAGQVRRRQLRAMDAIREMPQTALLAGTALVACVFLALISSFRRSPKDAPPAVRMGMPVFGNIAAFLRSPLNMIRDCYDK